MWYEPVLLLYIKYSIIINLTNIQFQPEVKEVLDVVMHSRLISAYIKDWVKWKEVDCKSSRDFKLARDK